MWESKRSGNTSPLTCTLRNYRDQDSATAHFGLHIGIWRVTFLKFMSTKLRNFQAPWNLTIQLLWTGFVEWKKTTIMAEGVGALPKVFGGAVWSKPQNPISDQNLWFPYPFSDLSEKLKTHFRPLQLVHDSNIWPQLTRIGFQLPQHLRRATNLAMLMWKK